MTKNTTNQELPANQGSSTWCTAIPTVSSFLFHTYGAQCSYIKTIVYHELKRHFTHNPHLNLGMQCVDKEHPRINIKITPDLQPLK